ncbi:MAG: hypothetical protein HY680_03425 [Chloroflexi bacterium]|nr:hypothetical protein [Chloroflexota bacterium]
MNGLTTRFGAAALKRALFFGLIGAFLMSFMAVNTLSSTSSSATVTLANESFTSDLDTAITWSGLSKQNSNAAASGDSAPGIEATSSLPAIQTALTKNDYVYSFEFKEAAVASWGAGRQYKVEVYGDDGSTVTLLATLYTQQAVASDAAIDGVTVKVDTGSSSTAYDGYSIVITKVA